jgi:hypothetical protein
MKSVKTFGMNGLILNKICITNYNIISKMFRSLLILL